MLHTENTNKNRYERKENKGYEGESILNENIKIHDGNKQTSGHNVQHMNTNGTITGRMAIR